MRALRAKHIPRLTVVSGRKQQQYNLHLCKSTPQLQNKEPSGSIHFQRSTLGTKMTLSNQRLCICSVRLAVWTDHPRHRLSEDIVKS